MSPKLEVGYTTNHHTMSDKTYLTQNYAHNYNHNV